MDQPADRPTALEAETESLDQIDYAKACRLWAMSDQWRLDDALNLLLSIRPALCGDQSVSGETAARRTILGEIARGCLGRSLPFIQDPCEPSTLRVDPDDFLKWAESRGVPVPNDLRNALDNAPYRSSSEDAPIRPSTRHRIRAQAVAALLWAESPDMTIKAMCEQPAIREYGCEGKGYAGKTLHDWLKVVAPSRHPGRPKGKKPPATP